MERSERTQEQILEIMNEKLHRVEDCRGWRFRPPLYRYGEPKEDGCNWSPWVNMDAGSAACGKNIREDVIASARERYNLLPPV